MLTGHSGQDSALPRAVHDTNFEEAAPKLKEMVEMEIVPEMEQRLREIVKGIEMSMRDIVQSDFDELEGKEVEKKDEEELNIVQKSRKLKAENEYLSKRIASMEASKKSQKEILRNL